MQQPSNITTYQQHAEAIKELQQRANSSNLELCIEIAKYYEMHLPLTAVNANDNKGLKKQQTAIKKHLMEVTGLSNVSIQKKKKVGDYITVNLVNDNDLMQLSEREILRMMQPPKEPKSNVTKLPTETVPKKEYEKVYYQAEELRQTSEKLSKWKKQMIDAIKEQDLETIRDLMGR
jgi:hypothetical protein